MASQMIPKGYTRFKVEGPYPLLRPIVAEYPKIQIASSLRTSTVDIPDDDALEFKAKVMDVPELEIETVDPIQEDSV